MSMAKICGDGYDPWDCKLVYVDTNLDTHLAIPVSYTDTLVDLKRKLLTEHLKRFVKFGEIEILYLQVEQKRELYILPDFVSVRSVFAETSGSWFLFADISSQSSQLLPSPSLAKDETNLQTGNLVGGAMSENLRLVADFDNDDNAKSSSSDTLKRVNVLVEDICNAYAEKEQVPVFRSARKGRNSGGLLTDVPAVNPIRKCSDVVSVEKNKPKKKRKVANVVEIGSVDKDLASQKLEVVKNLDQNGDDCVGNGGENKQEDESFEINDCRRPFLDGKNRSGAEIEKSVDHHGEGNKNLETHDGDMQDVTTEIDKAKGTAKKKKKKTTKAEAMNGETFADIDASVNVSAKSHDVPGIPINMDKDGTEELGGLKSVPDVRDCEKEATTFGVPPESGLRKSKKRKNGGDDVSHQMDLKGNKELGVGDIGVIETEAKRIAEVPELGMTRPLKRKKTGDDLPVVIKMDGVGDAKSGRVNSKQQNQTLNSKRKIKQMQTPAVKNITDFMGDQMDTTMETEKRKSTFSKSAVEKDDKIKSLSSPHHNQIDKSVAEVTSEADIETTTNILVDGEVIIANHESDVKTQTGADETIHTDPEPMLLTQVQKSEEGAETKNKRSNKKTKQKQNLVVKSVSELPVIDENNNMKHDMSKSACSKLTPEKNDEMELPSSCQEQIDEAASMVDANADIEMKNAKAGMGDRVIDTDHGSDVIHRKEADETMQSDAEPIQLTQIQKSEKDNGSKSVKSKKKIKQKQSHPIKSSSEFSVADQNNTLKLERGKSTLPRSEAEKDEVECLFSPVEQIDSASLISAPQADAEISPKTHVGEVILTNHGSGVNLQQEADAEISPKTHVGEVIITNHGSGVNLQQEAVDDSCQHVEPIQSTQAQRSKRDTEKKSVQTKKKTKQQQTLTGKNLPKAVDGEQDDPKNDLALEKDTVIAPAEAPLNAAKYKGSEQTSSGSKHLQKSTDVVQQERSKDSSSAKRHNAADPIEFIVEGSSLIGQSADAVKQDRSILSAEHFAAADTLKSKVENSATKTKDRVSLKNGTRVGNRNDSRTSSSHSDALNKRSRQGKAMKELPKMKLTQSILRNSSNKITKKVVHKPVEKRSLILKTRSIFKDESSSSSSEDKGGRDAVDSSAETPYDDHVSSDCSEDESRGSWVSPKHGNSKNGGDASNSKSMQKNMTMESILRSSQKFKKAKLVASQLQLLDEESQPVDIVPDSQANT